MGNTSSVNNANNANWQNYQQAFLNSATNNASSQNAATGSELGALGTIAGAAIMMA
jgi:PAB1-binding protein PBP1